MAGDRQAHVGDMVDLVGGGPLSGPQPVGQPADHRVGCQGGVEVGGGAAQCGERLVQQRRQRAAGRRPLRRQPLPHAAAVPQDGERGGGDVLVRSLGQHARDPPPHLALGRRILGHLVREVALKALGAVLEGCGDERVLGREVPVEGVVRQARSGDDVGDPGPRPRAARPHHGEGGVEQAPDLPGVARLQPGQRPLRDAGRHPVRLGVARSATAGHNIVRLVRNCISH